MSLFDADFTNTRYVEDYTLDLEVAQLANLRGHGTIADLHIVASIDSTLDSNGETIKDKLLNFENMTLYDWIALAYDPAELKDKVKTLLYHWAGVEGEPSYSWGVHVEDARPFEFMEKYLNRSFGTNGVGVIQGSLMGNAMSQAVGKLTADILQQVAAKNLFIDQLYGGVGTDAIRGEAGNDILIVGDGADTLIGGADADAFMFVSNTTSDIISDFSTAQGDMIDVSELLTGYDPLTHAITDFVEIVTSGSNSILEIDSDGGANSFVQIAQINGVTGLTDEAALVTSGNLVVL